MTDMKVSNRGVQENEVLFGGHWGLNMGFWL